MFHLYGFILGLAAVLGTTLIYHQAKLRQFSASELDRLAPWIIIAGIIGARLYHVVTSGGYYLDDVVAIFKVWQGGLSVIGAIIGGVTGAALGLKTGRFAIRLGQLLDLSIYGVPIAQAIGRVGNYVNQELYGLPTTVPWGIYIDPQNRLQGYEGNERFHPLFAYEMIGTAAFGGVLWLLSSRGKVAKIGHGKIFLLYVVYYSFLRAALDLLRPDKAVIPGTVLGLNQVLLVILGISALLYLILVMQRKRNAT
ncbi:MAG: prolipoprotein diacylglyceryl transferase [bacterium]|nr:prolipoprotein diacylglyceryl transferase [bacterium]